MTHPALRVLPILALLALPACSNDSSLTRTFGLTRDAPDEFQVTTRAPLSMPPDYTLRPPRPGASRPQELPLATQAEATLVPEAALADNSKAGSAGQTALLQAAGPQASNDIRHKVDEEAQLDRPGSNITDKLLFWRDSPQPGTVVDPQKESQRLRQDAALGESPRQGDTPIVQKKNGSLLDGLF